MSDNLLDGDVFENRAELYLNQHFWDRINEVRTEIDEVDLSFFMEHAILVVTVHLNQALNILVPTEDQSSFTDAGEKILDNYKQVGNIPNHKIEKQLWIAKLQLIHNDLLDALAANKIKREHTKPNTGPTMALLKIRFAIRTLENPFYHPGRDGFRDNVPLSMD